MTAFDDARATTDAIRDVTTRSGGVSSHDRAVQEYLIALQVQVRRRETADIKPHLDHPPETATEPVAAPTDAPADRPAVAPEPADTAEGRPQGAIVVGVDGSAPSAVAVDWAADEADRRHAPLQLVHAYRLPGVAGYPGYNAIPDDLLEQLRRAGQELLAGTARRIAIDHPSLEVVTTLVHGRGETAIRGASRGARLTVVGHSTTSRVAGVLLGSVALAVTSTNPAPVAVIPEDHRRVRGPIVVGVDGSPLSEAAVAFAFDEAALRGADLIAVHAWHDIYLDSRDLEPLLVDPRTLQQQERALLSERVGGWAEKYPDVHVRKVLRHQRPTTALLEYGRAAQAVVVGSRGRGGFAGMMLGSTSHALATHARCPVIIVRPPESER